MLIRFSVKNWMSYRDEVTFSMVASSERQHSNRLSFLKKYNKRILPIAAIYGGNASGKTNLFKALSFVKTLVEQGTQPDDLLSVETFSLDAQSSQLPSYFSFTLLIGEEIYEFNFSLNRKEILEENLTKIQKNKEIYLYKRIKGKITFNESNKFLEEKNFLEFVAKGTRNNQLFLTNSMVLNVASFKPISDWFKNSLQLVNPGAKFDFYSEYLSHNEYKLMNDMLAKLDTGVHEIKVEEIPVDDNLYLPRDIIRQFIEVKGGRIVMPSPHPAQGNIVLTHKEGKIIGKKLTTYHRTSEDMDVKFELDQESDGTRRIIDLLPAFLELFTLDAQKVYVIDEIDRSLHTLLTKRLIEDYLAFCRPESRNQLLLTTHDVLLMDQHLLRRDEMWVTERSQDGSTTLYSFSEYKDVRYDKDLRKSYLQGRLGGIPKLLLRNNEMSESSPQKK